MNICSEHKGRYFEKFVIRLFWDTIDFHSRRKILLCFPHSSEYLPLCSEQTHSYRFGSTWGWVNDHFWVNYPFNCLLGRINQFSLWIPSVSAAQQGALKEPSPANDENKPPGSRRKQGKDRSVFVLLWKPVQLPVHIWGVLQELAGPGTAAGVRSS